MLSPAEIVELNRPAVERRNAENKQQRRHQREQERTDKIEAKREQREREQQCQQERKERLQQEAERKKQAEIDDHAPPAAAITGPRIWGYSRCSKNDKDDSVEGQAERFRQRAASLEDNGHGKLVHIFEENVSAERVPYDERPAFAAFMKACERGDTLIVWRLDRIDRNPYRMIRAVEFLVNRQVRLIVLKEHAGMQLDLSTAAGRAFIFLGAIFADFWMEYQKEAVRAAIDRCRRNGLPYSCHIPFGKRRVEVPDKGRRSGKRKIDVWDDGECRQICELVRRRRAGEKILAIARDWAARRLKRACGVRWAKIYGKRRYPNSKKVHDAYEWAEKELKEHTHIGNVPFVEE